jgi:hypothetical protein
MDLITSTQRYQMLNSARFLFLLLLIFANWANAAPKHVDLVYQATRNGQPFATVTESYRQEKGRYRIESVTTGIGVYALFGKRRLTSEGEVGADGLKPSHFELHQGDNISKSLFADFDWAASTLTMKIKGETNVVPLQKGTQDLSSFAYQFMFTPPVGDVLNLPMTTGKKLNLYNYTLTEKNELLEIAAGKFKTVHLVKARDKDADPASVKDEKELWLGLGNHYLPVRLVMVDDHGVKIEQTLTSLHVE